MNQVVKAALSQRAAEKTYGVLDELLTCVPWNLYELRKRWNVVKHEVAPWRERSKEAYSSMLHTASRFIPLRRPARHARP